MRAKRITVTVLNTARSILKLAGNCGAISSPWAEYTVAQHQLLLILTVRQAQECGVNRTARSLDSISEATDSGMGLRSSLWVQGIDCHGARIVLIFSIEAYVQDRFSLLIQFTEENMRVPQ